jgi:hypothetical protein
VVELRVPETVDLLTAWERGLQDESERAAALCAAVSRGGPSDALPLGHRNRLLLAARAMLFGQAAEVVADCDGCGARLEAQIAVDDLLAPVPEGGSVAPEVAAAVELTEDGYTVRTRVPTGADLSSLPADVDQAAQELLARCVLDATCADRPVEPSRLPSAVVARLEHALAEADPDALVQVELICPTCHAARLLPLDPVAFLWTEVDTWAWRLLSDVHLLAAAYGWEEGDILAMSPSRRQAYLHLSGAGAA